MNRKEEWIATASTEVLERIVRTAAYPERSPDRPLSGVVHIEGKGHIEISAIRRELAERERVRAERLWRHDARA